MDYTQIIQAVIALISALISAFLIPWIKQNVDAGKLEKVRAYVEIAVKAAEQLYAVTDGEKKKAYVLNYLTEKGILFDSETVDKLIEAAVLQLHHELYGGKTE
uniref:Holin n=1 Tax=Siphoviridae sp. ctSMg55 TaxID=2825509 RepID=A0A8S5V504_9CAUD|nr:MAG TPA: holin [Siphoviridae sp. ctSMg55]